MSRKFQSSVIVPGSASSQAFFQGANLKVLNQSGFSLTAPRPELKVEASKKSKTKLFGLR
jgi:hypothetical protein